MTLLSCFLKEEVTDYVRGVLLSAIKNEGGADKLTLEFNRFEVALNFNEGTAHIVDILDSSSAGELLIDIEGLRKSLEIGQ